MIKYAAFLRGINVGGRKTIKMDALRRAFESSGFSDVKTVLASGNVLFSGSPENENNLAPRIGTMLKKELGREIGVMVRKLEILKRLEENNPFAGVKVTPQTRLYVTFLPPETTPDLNLPFISPGGQLKIIHATAGEVFSVLTLSPDSRTIDLMGILEKEFGKQVTTRNWNTVKKILKATH